MNLKERFELHKDTFVSSVDRLIRTLHESRYIDDAQAVEKFMRLLALELHFERGQKVIIRNKFWCFSFENRHRSSYL